MEAKSRERGSPSEIGFAAIGKKGLKKVGSEATYRNERGIGECAMF